MTPNGQARRRALRRDSHNGCDSSDGSARASTDECDELSAAAHVLCDEELCGEELRACDEDAFGGVGLGLGVSCRDDGADDAGVGASAGASEADARDGVVVVVEATASDSVEESASAACVSCLRAAIERQVASQQVCSFVSRLFDG